MKQLSYHSTLVLAVGIMAVVSMLYAAAGFPLAFTAPVALASIESVDGSVGHSYGGHEGLYAVNTHDVLSKHHLKGEGNAYACLDAQGELYRSDTPCK